MMMRMTLVAAVAACAVHAADIVVGVPSEQSPECKALNCPQACVDIDGKWQCKEIEGLVPWQPTNPCQIVRCSADTQCVVDSNGKAQCEPVDLVPTPPTNPCQTVRCASGTRCIVDVEGQPQCVHWPFGCAPFGDKVCPKGTCCKEKFGIGYCGQCETTVCCRMMPFCPRGFEEAKSTECNVLDYLTGRCKVVDMCCDSIMCKRVSKY
eukprot:TRINITY_DN1367_c0_g2_i6.p1 TRINITY_DN1367_c0_g2~~TRINITY_DN1367_c0_g2_i6.p1  ORF type:complete len:208 (+),score=74.78 TRINITY_DN1367_c0_g2_i6:794-1417(+)